MKIRNKLSKGSIILFLVVMLLDLCVLMIISNYLEVSYLTEKVRLIYGEITVSFFISFIIGFSYWFHCRFDFIEAGRIMGASKIQIAINLISEFGTAVLAGSVAGSLLTMAAKNEYVSDNHRFFIDISDRNSIYLYKFVQDI